MNIIKVAKLNNELVKAIPQFAGGAIDLRPVKGANIFEEVYANIFLCAKKKSGKTCCIFKILKDCVGRDTTIIVFSSTLNKDKNMINIRKYFEDKGNTFIGYTSLMEDGTDQLAELVGHLQQEAEEELKAEKEERPKKKNLLNTNDPEEEKKQKKTKYLAPEYIIVCDDLAAELKSKSLVNLLKMNRHFKSKIIISTQYVNDVLPEGLKQMDYWLVFRGMSEDKLVKIHKDADIAVPFAVFEKIYKHATMLPYSFLYIDTRNDSFRMSFHKKFILPDNI